MQKEHAKYVENYRKTFHWRIFIALVILIGIGIAISQSKQLAAQAGANCSGNYFIDQSLPTGARWQMCWENRNLEGIVLYDVYYTPLGGTARKVLAQANLAQIHVPYDDNGARYHDSTDSGLGGSYLSTLSSFDCPNGTLLSHLGRNVVCLQMQPRGYAYRYTTSGVDKGLQGYQLRLFSISHVGEYNYIAQWDFTDDGAIKPQVGATGKLQRLGTYVQPKNGWPLRTEAGAVVYGVSHTHNYYWRLDFDIGDKANDLVEEINFTPANLDQEREINVTPLPVETARSRNAETFRSWRIRDKAITNSDGHYISYDILPASGAARFVGPDYEPFTHNDFYVTVYNPCERFVSHNPAPCQPDVSDFVNGENTDGADLVLWYGINFHHLVRDEDESFMPVHWDGFSMYPRDWTASNPLDVLAQNIGATGTPATATNTPVPPTATPIPATATSTSTNTKTATSTTTPTKTAIPATATNTTAATLTPTVTATRGNSQKTKTPTPAVSLINTATPTDTATTLPTTTPTTTPTSTGTNASGTALCAVYTSVDVPKPLPNGTLDVTSILNVPNAVTISDVNINVDLSHTYVGDLTLILTQLSTNKSVTIFDQPGKPASSTGCPYDDLITTLGDEALLPVEDQCATAQPTINGSFKPNNPLSLFDGAQSNGTWTLKIIDNQPNSDGGTLNSWSLQICSGGESPPDAAFSENITSFVASKLVPLEPEKATGGSQIFLPLVAR